MLEGRSIDNNHTRPNTVLLNTSKLTVNMQEEYNIIIEKFPRIGNAPLKAILNIQLRSLKLFTYLVITKSITFNNTNII